MKLEKIILLLDKENNDDLLDYVIPFIREYSSIVYFLYVIEIPVKYEINYDLNGENFILLQSRNSGVGIVKEAKRIKANVIIYRKQKNDDSYKYKYIDKYSEVDTIQLFKV